MFDCLEKNNLIYLGDSSSAEGTFNDECLVYNTINKSFFMVEKYNNDPLVLKKATMGLMKNVFVTGCNLVKDNIRGELFETP